ncbi:MAG: hypothetical protein EOP83_03510 [Verrucomicrobiaceae bacterium]|nr:MAG: hypothetical protein EOP83_03510 [Verrucomicrobiaceae bacterium]
MKLIEWSVRTHRGSPFPYEFRADPINSMRGFLEQMEERRAWCYEQFSDTAGCLDGWYWSKYSFFFADPAAATAFKMRWL